MRKLLRKVFRLFAVQWSLTLQYRGDMLIWTMTEAITPLIALSVWFTVTSQGESIWQPRDTLTYYVLTLLGITVTSTWISYYLTQDILDGTIVKYLVRPVPMFWQFISNNLVEKFFKLALPLPLIMMAFALAPHFFSPSIYQPSRVLLAVMSLVLGAAIALVVDSILATFAFWLEDAHQIIGFHYLLWTIGAGVLIPYALLPEAVRTTLSFMPYRYIISAPIEILVRPSATLPAGALIGIQLAWICGLTLILRILWKQGLKRYAIPGQ